MKAAVLHKAGQLTVGECPDPICPDGGVLVSITACGICSADAKMIANGHRALVYPRIPGHELAGVVMESRTPRFKVDDRVHIAPGLRCGRCDRCRSGRDNQCRDRQIIGFTRDGGFAQMIAVPLTGPVVGSLNPIPETISPAAATLAEPLACCLNAQEKMMTTPGDRILIVGAGPLGCLHAVAARHNRAGTVLMTEVEAHRRAAAGMFSPDRVIDPATADIEAVVMDETRGEGVDAIVLACSGLTVDAPLLNLLAPGGRLSVFSGLAPQAADARLDMNLIHYNEIRIAGAYGCTAAQNRQAMALIASGTHPLERMITHRTSLENIRSGLDHTSRRTALKSILEVNNE